MSYHSMLVNVAEKVEIMRQIRRDSVYTKGNQIISGAQGFNGLSINTLHFFKVKAKQSQ